MSLEYATLVIHIRSKEIREREEKDDKKEHYPVDMTLQIPDDADNEFPTGYLSSEISEWKSQGYSSEDGRQLFDLFFADSQLRQNWRESRGPGDRKVRVRLRFDGDETIAPLHAVPWEVLCDTTVDPPRQTIGIPPFLAM